MMQSYLAAGFGTTVNTLLASVLLVGLGLWGARYCRVRRPLAYFFIQFLVFFSLTTLMLARDIVPYRPSAAVQPAPERLFVGLLEILWWLGAAWLTSGFLRAFVVLGRKPTEAKLVQDLLAALIYLAATFAIVADVFDLPVKGLLATSGALAIIIGLALQSSLGDVFSGIVLNLERPYHVGDWIILDGTLQGTVLETNWRATHILTTSGDIAVIPNSVVARSKLINCSAPTKVHGATTRIRLESSLMPAAGCDLMREVLLGSTHILRTPRPTVAIKDVSADMIDFELGFSVADIGIVDDAKNEVFDRVYRAATTA